MTARRDAVFRPARRRVTFAWPVAAAALVCAVVALRWPRARYTPARGARAAQPAMAFVELRDGAEGFLWPRDFTRGLMEDWPRELDMDTPVRQAPPPIPFRAWPADEPGPDIETEPAE